MRPEMKRKHLRFSGFTGMQTSANWQADSFDGRGGKSSVL